MLSAHGLPDKTLHQPWRPPRSRGERLQTANLQREVEGRNDLGTYSSFFASFITTTPGNDVEPRSHVEKSHVPKLFQGQQSIAIYIYRIYIYICKEYIYI